jgi:hypothetical protein
VYNWYEQEHERVADHKAAFEKHGISRFAATTATRVPKTRNIKLNLQTEAGRTRYEKITGQAVEDDTTIEMATLTVQVGS